MHMSNSVVIRAAVVGASGYAGAELIRIIHAHSHFELGAIAAGANAGANLTDVHPQFSSVPELASKVFVASTPTELVGHDLVFLALPHGQSAELIAQLPNEVRIVDLGADYRLEDDKDWHTYYGGAYAGSWTYGIPEIHGQREKISGNTRIANPGCYATSIELGLAPLLAAGLADPKDIIVVAASGTSGAGRGAKVNLLNSEVAGSMSTYKVGGTHQHTPEIEQTLSKLAGTEVQINFTPMLAPMPRGILATISVKTELGGAKLREAMIDYYAGEAFVTVLPEGALPVTASTLGSNAVHIQVAKDDRTNRATVIVAIDNLIKGAAGQAVQNANLICGFPETAGLTAIGIAP
jgi:N-acetyl-gamma-glutamyl-phosphate reductase